MAECAFCRIVTGQLPASIVHHDQLTIAFMDIAPIAPGHILVATTAHVETIYELNDVQAGALFHTATRVARAIKGALRPDGLTVLQANERPGGQVVMHIHLHLVPRRVRDGLGFTWPAGQPARSELDRVAAMVRGALA